MKVDSDLRLRFNVMRNHKHLSAPSVAAVIKPNISPEVLKAEAELSESELFKEAASAPRSRASHDLFVRQPISERESDGQTDSYLS